MKCINCQNRCECCENKLTEKEWLHNEIDQPKISSVVVTDRPYYVIFYNKPSKIAYEQKCNYLAITHLGSANLAYVGETGAIDDIYDNGDIIVSIRQSTISEKELEDIQNKQMSIEE
jgi:hypothetical protein